MPDEHDYPGSPTIAEAPRLGVSSTNFQTVKRGGVLASELIDKRRAKAGDAGQSFEEISLLDASDPFSVMSLAPSSLREVVKTIPPDAWSMTFYNLERKAGITAQDSQTRLAFWDEFALAQDQKKKMNFNNVTKVTNRNYFYDAFLKDPYKVAYLLTPPQKYQYKMREMLDLAHTRMREVLQLPLVDKKGTPNTRLISEIVKIAILLENRVMGAVSQKLQVETKSLNVNVNTERKTYHSIEEELKAVERQLQDLRSGGSGLLTEIIDDEREISVGDAGLIGDEQSAFAENEDGSGAGEAPEGTGE